jgi:S-DNA-T family DNA segregation ATPase FtsK/SpoIIIE
MATGNDPVDWDAYEQELSTLDTDTPLLVDSAPDVQFHVAPRGESRKPVLPAWLRSPRAMRDTARWAAGYAAHTFAFHLMRTPVYVGKLAARSPRGLWRAVRGGFRWGFDLEGEPVRQAAVRREDAADYLKLSAQRDNRVRLRTFLTLSGLVLACCGVWWVATMPAWQRFALLSVVVMLLGFAGARPDKPLLSRAVVTARVARLTSDVVVKALSSLSLAGISQALSKNPNAIGFPAPIQRDGPGWRADIDLPAGVTAGEVIDRRDKLASGLGRPLGCVWPEAAHEIHPGRLVLWVGDQDMASAKQPSWPLVRSGVVDLFKPFPLGTDPRGRVISLEMVFTNLLIGSIPGMGKTFSLRLPLLAAALDPRAEIWVFELKGTGDLEPLSKVAARYGSGADDDTAEAALLALRDLRKECARRAETIRGLPKTVCPENKVTPQLAAQKGLGLHLLVVAIDECQELFAHSDFGKEAGELAERIIKLGRALGVILLLATQRPDAKSLPTGISANVGTRLCLRVMGQMENDMILSTSMYRNGVRATMFTKRDKGVGYLVGAGDEPQIVRTFYVDAPAADKICDRARAAREAAGTLTGHAIGQAPTARRVDTLLDDVLTALPAGEARVWSETVVEGLGQLNPDLYGNWTAEQLAAQLKPYGVDTYQIGRRVDRKTINRRGINRADILNAITDRDRRRRSG